MARTTHGTKQRIVDEALRLFAEQGFKATSVAEIEAAAGLAPGSGGLYKHFPSKQAVLAEAVRQDLEHLRDVQAALPELAEGAGDLAGPARLALAEMDRSRHLGVVLLRESTTLVDVVPEIHEAWVHGTYRTGAEHLRRQAEAAGGQVEGIDFEAQAFLGLAPLVLHRIITWLTGTPPAGIDDDRLVAAWTQAFGTAQGAIVEEVG